jgi:hypothetical protein
MFLTADLSSSRQNNYLAKMQKGIEFSILIVYNRVDIMFKGVTV